MIHLDDKDVERFKEATCVLEKEKVRKSIFTPDGRFKWLRFKDKYGKDCRISELSLATESCLWFGDMHIDANMAGQIASILFHFSKYEELPSYFFHWGR